MCAILSWIVLGLELGIGLILLIIITIIIEFMYRDMVITSEALISLCWLMLS